MFKVVMPRLDDGMQSGKIIEWLKKEGDHVEKDVPIVRIEGEKNHIRSELPGIRRSPETSVRARHRR